MEKKPYRGQILIDAREFVPGRTTGIGRVLEGLIDALANGHTVGRLILAVKTRECVPVGLINKDNIIIQEIPHSFFKSEKALSGLTNHGIDLFISPYPKLPLFGCGCLAVHFIHDVLDLTHPAYRRGFKRYFDGWRLRRALKRADLTWYVSSWSQKETKRYAGFIGSNSKVRYSGINNRFDGKDSKDGSSSLTKYNLKPGYILVLGNGRPHKNLGVLLKAPNHVHRPYVFIGVSERNQRYWTSKYPESKANWIGHAAEKDLPLIMKGAFCLAQPSTSEGYGYPPLEAMACGTPSVVSNTPVLRETTGGNALFADSGDTETWLNGFNRLEDEKFYRNLVDKGLKWVEPLRGRKGWQNHVLDIERILEKA